MSAEQQPPAPAVDSGKQERVLESLPVPADWDKKDLDQKLDWLERCALPSSPTVSLKSCYYNGVKIVKWISFLYDILVKIADTLEESANNKLRAGIANVLEAFALGVGTLSDHIYDDCKALIRNGKYSDTSLPIKDISQIERFTKGKKKVKSIWELAVSFLERIVDEYPMLNKMTHANFSYRQLIDSFIKAGKEFFRLYNGEEGRDVEEPVTPKSEVASVAATPSKDATAPVPETETVPAAAAQPAMESVSDRTAEPASKAKRLRDEIPDNTAWAAMKVSRIVQVSHKKVPLVPIPKWKRPHDFPEVKMQFVEVLV